MEEPQAAQAPDDSKGDDVGASTDVPVSSQFDSVSGAIPVSHSSPSSALPVWVTNPPNDVNGRLAVVLESDPFEDRFGCDEDLDRRTRFVINQAAVQRCRQRGLPMDLNVRIGYDEIRMVAQERHYTTRTTSMGEMLQGRQLTVLDDTFLARLDRRIVDAVVDRRLVAAGIVSGSALLAVSLMFGAFRFVSRKDVDPLA